ncbi:uncharacterized protein [Triticum aestivum]|uniref:uncharacterized protein n=1 Tax=Triticum aestivum TaxID=4565 RepID=UPI001D0132A2|nr:uncharacterized protein LOC123070158 [Triticum aestivum]
MARVPGVGSGASGHVVVVLVSSTCGEERPVDNLAAARDEAATSFLLLRLQVLTMANIYSFRLITKSILRWFMWLRSCSNGSLKQIRRPGRLCQRGCRVKEMAVWE